MTCFRFKRSLSLSISTHTHTCSLFYARSRSRIHSSPLLHLSLSLVALLISSLPPSFAAFIQSLAVFHRHKSCHVCVCVLLCVYNWIGVCYKCLKHTHSFRFDFYGEFGMKESEQLWERERANDIGTVNNTVALYILPAPQRFRIGIEGAYCILTLSAEPCMNISRSSIWSLIICVWGRTSMIHTDPNRKEWNGKRICTWVNEHRRSHVSNMLARSLAVISLRGKIYLYIHT